MRVAAVPLCDCVVDAAGTLGRRASSLENGFREHPASVAASATTVSRRLKFGQILLRDIIRECSIQFGSGLYFQGVAILCQSGVAGAANYVTFLAADAVRKSVFQAALSDILFNKVKRLGRFLGNLREIMPDLLCFKGLSLTRERVMGISADYDKTENTRVS